MRFKKANTVVMLFEFLEMETPEENTHIEAYDSKLKKEVFTKFEYHIIGEIRQILKHFVKFCNNDRPHQLLRKTIPIKK